MMSGTMGPRILVSKEITKNVRIPGDRVAAFRHELPFSSTIQESRPNTALNRLVPDRSGADEIGVFPERSHFQSRLFMRNESATLADNFANAVKKKDALFMTLRLRRSRLARKN